MEVFAFLNSNTRHEGKLGEWKEADNLKNNLFQEVSRNLLMNIIFQFSS